MKVLFVEYPKCSTCKKAGKWLKDHDVDFVRSIARKVTVLHQGSVLAEGSMDEVQNDPRVVEVYLGE